MGVVRDAVSMGIFPNENSTARRFRIPSDAENALTALEFGCRSGSAKRLERLDVESTMNRFRLNGAVRALSTSERRRFTGNTASIPSALH